MKFRTLAAVLGLAALCSAAAAQTFPDRAIRMIVPFPPGGGTDLIARVLGQGLTAEIGQPIIIDNRAGAGTIIGTDAAAKSAPDGYTLVVATFANAANPSLKAKLPYDWEKDLAPIILLARSPNVLVVRKESPFRTVQELVAGAKAKPGGLNYASQGVGTSAHLAGELFRSLAGADIVHVPYRGASQALNDLVSGQIEMMFATSAAVQGFLEAGTLRALGVTTAGRSPTHKDTPSIAEAGVPGYAAESWYGIYAPGGTPQPIVARLNGAIGKTIASADFRKRTEPEGLVIAGGSPEDLDRYFRGEVARWKKAIADANIKPD